MPGVMYGPRKTYLSIAQGAIRQTVSETTEGAIRRDYEMKDGVKGHKFEFVFQEWQGRIIDIRVKDGKFGEVCEVEFEDAILSLGTKSRYFIDLVKKLMNVNINQTVTFKPYDFEADGKKLVGISITQRGEKIPNYYWDTVKMKTINGFPVPNFNTKQAKTRDWELYWITVQGFLVDEVAKIKSNISVATPESIEEEYHEDDTQTLATESKEKPQWEITEDDIPLVGIKKKEDDDINIDEVPF